VKLSKEPAVLLGFVGAIIAAVTEALDAANAGGTLDVWTLVVVLVPLLVGIAVRYLVVSAETVRETLTRARTATQAVNDLADRVDVAVQDRPNG
jgi:hypothetical protein